MARRTSEGKCSLCGGTFTKAAMAKHLESCTREATKPSSSRRSPKTKLLRLVVEGRDLPKYWMHLEVPANATLEDLDDFLRRTWLECCGHLSAFTIGDVCYYDSETSEELGSEIMDVALGEVLNTGMKFTHEYDFGTTTELTLRVVSEREGEVGREAIRLLARNEPPVIPCGSCGKPATNVCSVCIYEGTGWLCDECAGEHECGEEMLLPVVNSPRVGMCGYTG